VRHTWTPPDQPGRPSRTGAVVAGAAAAAVGAMVAYQSRVNGELAVMAGNGIQAAVVSFGTGLLILIVVLGLSPRYRDGVRRVVRAVRTGEMPWWQVAGGTLGGFFVAVQSITVPLVGVAVFTVAVVAGQTTSSLVVDRAGLGPAGRRPVTAARVVSALITLAAVVTAVSGRLGGVGIVEVWPILLALVAGALIAVQQAVNGRVGAVAGRAVSAAFVNFVFGFALLAVALVLGWAVTGAGPGPLPTGPWWVYTGGVVGVVFIATAAWAVQRLGVLLLALLSIGGQLLGALVIDLVAPTGGAAVHPTLVAGVLLAALAVAIGALAGRRAVREQIGGRAGWEP
jgi:bacterial/archaeal transporter family-2 protein